jgi:hypothetical protein
MTMEDFKTIMNTIIVEIQRKKEDCKLLSSKALIILDSHASRNCPSLWTLLKERGIDLLTLPSHSSHKIQPLDRGVNAILKEKLRQIWKKIPTALIGDYRSAIAHCLPTALHHSLSPESVIDSWKQSGLEPLAPSLILDPLPFTRDGTLDYFAKQSKTRVRIDGRLLTGEETIVSVLTPTAPEELEIEEDIGEEMVVLERRRVIDFSKTTDCEDDGLHILKVKRVKKEILRDDM